MTGFASNDDNGFPAFDDDDLQPPSAGAEFSPQGVNDFFDADFTNVETTPVTDMNWSSCGDSSCFATPRPLRRPSATSPGKSIHFDNFATTTNTTMADETTTNRMPGGPSSGQRRRNKDATAPLPHTPINKHQKHHQQSETPPTSASRHSASIRQHTPRPIHSATTTNNTNRRKASTRGQQQQRCEDVSASEQSGGEEFQLGRFLEFSQSEHMSKSINFNDEDDDDKEEEKSIYSMFQWSVSSGRNKPRKTAGRESRDSRSCNGDAGFEDTPRRPKQSSRRVDRSTLVGNNNNIDAAAAPALSDDSGGIMTSPKHAASRKASSKTTSSSSSNVKKPFMVDPKSDEAAKLREMLLQELEHRVTANAVANGKKKKKLLKKREDATTPSEHSHSSLRYKATPSASGGAGANGTIPPSSKEYRRMHKRLNNHGEQQPDHNDVFSQPTATTQTRERSSKTRLSSRSNHSIGSNKNNNRDIQFQPSSSSSNKPTRQPSDNLSRISSHSRNSHSSNNNHYNNNNNKTASLDIHFQTQIRDVTHRAPPDVRSIFSARSRQSQSESEESFRFLEDDGTVLQFDPTQEDHVAKRRIGRQGSSYNMGLGDSVTSKGLESVVPQQQQQQQESVPPQQHQQQRHVSNNNKLQHDQRRMQEKRNNNKCESTTTTQAVPAPTTTTEADAAAGVAQTDFPPPPPDFMSPSMISTATTPATAGKGSKKRGGGFFVRRRTSNDTDGGGGGGGHDESITVCSYRSESMQGVGCSTTETTSTTTNGNNSNNNNTSSRRLGVGGGPGGAAARRGTSLSMLRRRSGSSDAENNNGGGGGSDDRSLVSNNTETSGFRSRYGRRSTSRRGGSGKHDHKRLLDDDSDSDY